MQALLGVGGPAAGKGRIEPGATVSGEFLVLQLQGFCAPVANLLLESVPHGSERVVEVAMHSILHLGEVSGGAVLCRVAQGRGLEAGTHPAGGGQRGQQHLLAGVGGPQIDVRIAPGVARFARLGDLDVFEAMGDDVAPTVCELGAVDDLVLEKHQQPQGLTPVARVDENGALLQQRPVALQQHADGGVQQRMPRRYEIGHGPVGHRYLVALEADPLVVPQQSAAACDSVPGAQNRRHAGDLVATGPPAGRPAHRADRRRPERSGARSRAAACGRVPVPSRRGWSPCGPPAGCR